MKKILIFLLVCIVLGVSNFTFAHDESTLSGGENETTSDDNTTEYTDNSRDTNGSEEGPDTSETYLLRGQDIVEERLRNEKELMEAKERYLKIRKRLMERQENFEGIREKFRDFKERLQECRDNRSEDCRKSRREGRLEIKNFVVRSAEAIIAHLEKVKEKVQSREDLTSEEINQTVARINEKIQEIIEAKGVLENINASTTKEDILRAIHRINAAWKNTHPFLQRYLYANSGGRIKHLITKFERLGEKFEEKIKRLEDEGKSVNDVKVLLENYNALVKEAKDHYTLVVANLEQKKFDEARSHLQDAIDKLKAAREKAREIKRDIKVLQGNVDDLEDEENSTGGSE